MTLKELASKKEADYNSEYQAWCTANPGKISHGSWQKAQACKEASYLDTIEEVKVLLKLYDAKFFAAKGINGWRFGGLALNDLIAEYEDTNS
jgi:hypothetical protein